MISDANTITTENLMFGYNKTLILNALDLRVPQNSIYGYLGNNGAGKSTTMKLLLGLNQPKSGTIRYFGQEFNKYAKEILPRIGSLIESPSFYGDLTAYENLKWIDMIHRRGEKRIEEVLDILGLSNSKNKKLKNFSTGMKQRMGIAFSLFHDPEILILDEPLNGLDPSGIAEIRTLISALHQEGKTIFISSHILDELQKIATHLGVIHDGNLVFQGEAAEFVKRSSMNRLEITVNDFSSAQKVCITNNFEAVVENELLIVNIKDKYEHSKLIHTLSDSKIDIYGIKLIQNSLESMFLNITKKQSDGK